MNAHKKKIDLKFMRKNDDKQMSQYHAKELICHETWIKISISFRNTTYLHKAHE